ncbi:MAG: hypothetical protein AAGE89_16175 [Pseudomonadota bacterium]
MVDSINSDRNPLDALYEMEMKDRDMKDPISAAAAVDNDGDVSPVRTSRLEDSLRLIREQEADRSTAREDGRKAQYAHLELLRRDLSDVIDDIPDTIDFFDFQLSHGPRPRLWIDAAAFVTCAKDNDRFRLLRDTRNGRIVLADDKSRDSIQDAVIAYVAERIDLQNREIELPIGTPGGSTTDLPKPETEPEQTAPVSNDNTEPEETKVLRPRVVRGMSIGQGIILFSLGFISGAAALLALAWFHTELGL